MPPSSKSPETQAIELIAPRQFHQLFTLPATETHGVLKVSFSVCGKHDGEDETTPTIVFCGGMFGSRWQAPFHNWLAEKEGVRMIFIDRPGFGGSTKVPISERISTFLEVVPALLTHLNIKQISIGSHSSGTIFSLNLLQTHPRLLSPKNPSITLCSPWVHQSLSGTTMLTAAALLPNGLLNHWANLTGFVINKASPTFASSSGALSILSSLWGDKDARSKEEEEDELRCREGYGIGLEVKKELDKLVMKYAFAEECSGGNDEARLCLKSVPGTEWGVIKDYPSYIQTLKEQWEKKVNEGGGKLTVRILLAEEDIMIGDKGRQYIEDCWTSEKCGKGVEVECVVIEGTDHDGVVDPARGAMGEIYSALKGLRPSFIGSEGIKGRT